MSRLFPPCPGEFILINHETYSTEGFWKSSTRPLFVYFPSSGPHDGIEIYKQKPDQQGISPTHAGDKVWKTTQTESSSRRRGADVRGEDGDRRRREGGATAAGGRGDGGRAGRGPSGHVGPS